MNWTLVARIVCSIVGLIVISSFFVEAAWLQAWDKAATNWGIIISAFALGVGTVNLARRHIQRVTARKKDWFASALCLFFLVVMSVLGIVQSTGGDGYMFWFRAIIEACQSTVSSLVIFYIATSAFRAFRLRNLDASLLLLAGIATMAGQMPIGSAIHPGLPKIAEWLMNVVNVAGQRGIIISAGLGAVAAGMRVILGVERGPFKDEG